MLRQLCDSSKFLYISLSCASLITSPLLPDMTTRSYKQHLQKMETEIDSLLTILILLLLRRILARREKQVYRPRVCWVKPWLQRRHQLGAYDGLMVELANEDIPGYVAFQRLAPDLFAELLSKVGPLIQRQDTAMRKSVSPGARLALTLRYLATGNTYMSLQFEFRVKNNTISLIVPETCRALFAVLRDEYFRCPKTPEEWCRVADQFWRRWQFPNCLGAMDGKHVLLKKPALSGSKYFNYKHTFSVVLMGLVDANYMFLYVDVGCQGRISDGGVFHHTSLHEAIEDGRANLPADAPYPGDDVNSPFAIVADEAFPLRSYIMKPYPMRQLTWPQRIYNYRLSRARRIVENAFGILANRWRVFLTNMLITPERAEDVVLAACAIHNYLRTKLPSYTNTLLDQEDATTRQVIPGEWRRDRPLPNLTPLRGNTGMAAAKRQRDHLCDYVNGPGAVTWQDNVAAR